jgi:hypothetical protein
MAKAVVAADRARRSGIKQRLGTACQARAGGRLKTNRAPPVGACSTQMWPLWASSKALAMAKPSPARPPVSKRTKVSKMVSRSPGGTPEPISVTLIPTSPSVVRFASTVMTLPGGA